VAPVAPGWTSRPFYDPVTSRLLDTWLSRSQGYANDCASQPAQQTALLHNLTTIDSALNMDSIRQALGQQQINYYGYSYGTYLGQVYATLFPSRVRRMILDSTVDPRYVWYQSNLNQDQPFQRNLNIWFAWLAKYDSVYTSARPGRRWPGPSTRMSSNFSPIRPEAWSGATNGSTLSSPRPITSSPGLAAPRRSRIGSTCTTRRRPTS
jgi:pimeloyl-ACP methyl ester carboxylesterase